MDNYVELLEQNGYEIEMQESVYNGKNTKQATISKNYGHTWCYLYEFILKAILFIGIIFFGYGSIYFLKRMKTKKEMLIVNSKGITDNTSAISLGFIPWENIENVYKKVNEKFRKYKVE